MDNFWCVTVLFNPAGYRSRIANYFTFRHRLHRQNVNLLTIELAFNEQRYLLPKDDSILQLRSHSIMWQKERLLNYAISNLPPECDRVAWLDADLLLPDGWQHMLMDKLDTADFVQIFERVIHLTPGETRYGGKHQDIRPGIVWQSKSYKEDWLPLRRQRRLPHAEPGFGWAAQRKAIADGLYDRLILGSGDNFLADCLLRSKDLHHYWLKLTDPMLIDMEEWKRQFTGRTDGSVDYMPVDICHLWHGAMKDRAYETRDLIFHQYDFDPRVDMEIFHNVWEWATQKRGLHQAIIDYFTGRKEDGESGATRQQFGQ